MNANRNYFVYMQKDTTYVIDRSTGKIQTVKVVATLERLPKEVVLEYAGQYPNPDCRLVFETESGEQFAYPFSYGYASPEYIQEIVAAAAPAVEEAAVVAAPVAAKPSYFTAEIIAQRQAERAKRERADMCRTHPKTAMAYDIVEAINQPERFNRVWAGIQLIGMTMHSGASRLRDEDEKASYRELKAILSETNAELPAFRLFMEEVADWLGY